MKLSGIAGWKGFDESGLALVTVPSAGFLSPSGSCMKANSCCQRVSADSGSSVTHSLCSAAYARPLRSSASITLRRRRR